MEFTCENQQHFAWGTRLRVKNSDGEEKIVDIENIQKEQGFKMAEEGYPCNEDGSARGEDSVPAEESAPEEAPESER